MKSRGRSPSKRKRERRISLRLLFLTAALINMHAALRRQDRYRRCSESRVSRISSGELTIHSRNFSLQNQILAHNTSARIIWSNQSLVLQSVTRSSAGRYVCAATNALNETRSEPLHFRVKCKLMLKLRCSRRRSCGSERLRMALRNSPRRITGDPRRKAEDLRFGNFTSADY